MFCRVWNYMSYLMTEFSFWGEFNSVSFLIQIQELNSKSIFYSNQYWMVQSSKVYTHLFIIKWFYITVLVHNCCTIIWFLNCQISQQLGYSSGVFQEDCPLQNPHFGGMDFHWASPTFDSYCKFLYQLASGSILRLSRIWIAIPKCPDGILRHSN